MRVFSILFAACASVKVRDCGTNGIDLTSVKVEPCAVEPCELRHGKNYTIDISFNANSVDKLSMELCGYVGPLCVPFPVKAPSKKVNPGSNNFSFTMPIEPAYPSMKVVGKIELKSEDTTNKVCFKIPLKIMPDNEPKFVAPSIENIFVKSVDKIQATEDKWVKVLNKDVKEAKKKALNVLDQL